MKESLYTLTFEPSSSAPIVLADLKDDLLSEPVFEGRQKVDVVPQLRKAYAEVYHRGNVAREVSFIRVYSFPTANEARFFEVDHLSVIDALGKGRLKIEVKGQAARWLEGAVLTAETVEKDLSSMTHLQVGFDYRVYGGAFVAV